MDENQTAAPASKPAAAAPLRLYHKHFWKKIRVGSNEYAFRTLSLADAIEVEPHLNKILPLVTAGVGAHEFNAEDAAEVVGILQVLCPAILESVEDIAAINADVINAVLAFYRQQDWAKVRLVRALRSDAGDGEEAGSGLSDQDTFFALAGFCADRRRESVPQFLDQRIEYCMDAILGLHAEYKRKAAEGKIPHGDFAAMMGSLMGGKSYSRDSAPEWMKSLADFADKENEQS